MSDIKFVDGLYVDPPHEKAPDFVKGKVSIKVDKFIDWLSQQEASKGYINLDIKESKKGGWYVAVNTWKPNSDSDASRKNSDMPGGSDEGSTNKGGFKDDDIPFAQFERNTVA